MLFCHLPVHLSARLRTVKLDGSRQSLYTDVGNAAALLCNFLQPAAQAPGGGTDTRQLIRISYLVKHSTGSRTGKRIVAGSSADRP